MLAEVLLRYDEALSAVADGLRSIGEAPTTRLKTSGTIIDKLRRQPHLTLKNIRDLAGARVVRPMTLDEQDALAARVLELWPSATLIDRRKEPSYGYRAVHVVPRIDGCPVEIQLRTVFQDTWAQVMELLGDQWGRDIRYGGVPDNPDLKISATPNSLTRRDVVEIWKAQTNQIAGVADLENRLEELRRTPAVSPDRLTELEADVDELARPTREILRDMRLWLDEVHRTRQG